MDTRPPSRSNRCFTSVSRSPRPLRLNTRCRSSCRRERPGTTVSRATVMPTTSRTPTPRMGARRRIDGTPAVTIGDNSFARASQVNTSPAAIRAENGISFIHRNGSSVP